MNRQEIGLDVFLKFARVAKYSKNLWRDWSCAGFIINNSVVLAVILLLTIPVLANSAPAAFTDKFITCKFYVGQKFSFTFKFQYLQIPVKLFYCQDPVPAISITCKFIQPI